jgi:hypothetical protein
MRPRKFNQRRPRAHRRAAIFKLNQSWRKQVAPSQRPVTLHSETQFSRFATGTTCLISTAVPSKAPAATQPLTGRVPVFA